jgi:Flp pilus assembly pilin Flp
MHSPVPGVWHGPSEEVGRTGERPPHRCATSARVPRVVEHSSSSCGPAHLFLELLDTRLIQTLARDESGQDLTEHVLPLVIIALAVGTAIVAFRDEIIRLFNDASTEVQSY